MNSKLKSHILLLIANILFGINYTVAKDLMPVYLMPKAIIFVRVAITSFLFWALFSFGKNEKVEKKDLLLLSLCALFGVAFNQIMFFEGLNLSKPINVAIIQTINPILVLLMAAFLIKEKITTGKIIGIILGAAGAIYLILNKGDMTFSLKTFKGDIYIILNSASYAVYLVLLKPLMKKYSSITIMKWIFLFGFIFIAPFCYNSFTQVTWNFPLHIWFILGYVVIATTFVAYLMKTESMKFLSPTVVSMYIYLQPFFAALSAILLSRDILTTDKIISAVLIFTGVYIVSRN
ncbi:MAG: DMT family transporter [Bacteroidales bacterium]|nr:DMT family transporter [Bacteroidales bacterium]